MSEHDDLQTAAASQDEPKVVSNEEQPSNFNDGAAVNDNPYYNPTPYGRFNVNNFAGYVTYEEPVDERNYMYPFTGNLNTGYNEKPSRKFANPVPAGISSLGISLFTLSLLLFRTRHVTNDAIVIGPFLFLSCLIQIITGIWCIVLENTYAATILLCYAGFFGSYGATLCAGFDVVSAYDSTTELDSALGFYLSAWTIFALYTWIVTFKSTLPIFALTFCVWLFFLLLTIATFGGSLGCQKASAVFAFISAVCCFYVAFVGLSSKSNSFIVVPTTYSPFAVKPKGKKFWNARV